MKTLYKIDTYYEIGEKISEGGFGVIYEATRKIPEKTSVIVKQIIPKTPRELANEIFSEIFFLKKCQEFSNVIKLFDYFTYESIVYLVLEKLDNGIDLFDLITNFFPLDVKVMKAIFKEIVDVTIKLSSLNIYHFDIKDENVLLGYEGNITSNKLPRTCKLIDFGNARYGNKLFDKPFNPTSIYCPPEYVKLHIILPKEFTVWTLGCLLYNMITGEVPFKEVKFIGRDLNWNGRKEPLDLMNLAEKCLVNNPKNRTPLEKIDSII